MYYALHVTMGFFKSQMHTLHASLMCKALNKKLYTHVWVRQQEAVYTCMGASASQALACGLQGRRALDFVLKNQGLIDKTLLFDIELMRINQ